MKIASKFNAAYKNYFDITNTYIWQQKIVFGLEKSSRIDLVIRFKVSKTCGGKICNFGSYAER
jgi:hypothetical protein